MTALFTLIFISVVSFILLPFVKPSIFERTLEYLLEDSSHYLSLKKEKKIKMQALKELDFDFASGKLSKTDYKNIRSHYEREVLDIVKKLQTAALDFERVQKELDGHIKKIAPVLLVFTFPTFSATLEGSVNLSRRLPQTAKSNLPVRLAVVQNDTEVFGSETTLDSKGKFYFHQLKTDPTYYYFIELNVGSVPYLKGPYQFEASQHTLKTPPIEIYPSTFTLQNLKADEVVQIDVGKKDLLKFNHIVYFSNLSQEVYSPLNEKSELLYLGLPKGAHSLNLVDGISPNAIEIDSKNNRLVIRKPIFPTSDGLTSQAAKEKNTDFLAFNYLLPYSTKTLGISITSSVQKRTFNLSIDHTKARISAPHSTLTQHLKTQDLNANQPFTFSLRSLPLQNAWLNKILLLGAFINIFGFLFIYLKQKKRKPREESWIDFSAQEHLRLEKLKKQQLISTETFLDLSQKIRDFLFTKTTLPK